MHEAERRQLEHHRRGRPLGDQRGGHLDQRPGVDQRLQPLAEVAGGMALGMRDEAAKAAPGEPLDRQLEVLAERPGARLDEEPAPSPERHAPSVVVVELVEHRLRRPRRRSRPGLDLLPLQLGVDLRHPLLQLADHDGVVGWMCGVAQITSMPSASAWRAISTLSSRSRAPSSRPGQDVAVEVDHSGPVFPRPWWNSRMRRILVLVAAAIALAACGDDGQQRSIADRVVVQVGEATVRADLADDPASRAARALRPGEPRREERHALPTGQRLTLLLDEGHAVPDRHPLDPGRPRGRRERRRAPAAEPEFTASDLLPRPARRPRAGGESRLGRGPRDPPGRRRACAPWRRRPDRVRCDGARPQARPEHRLLERGPAAGRRGGGRRGRPARLRLDLDGGGLRLRRAHAARLVGLAARRTCGSARRSCRCRRASPPPPRWRR